MIPPDYWQEICSRLPSYGGVYSVWASGKLLYIGMAKNIRSRFKTHCHTREFIEFQADEIRHMQIDNYQYRYWTERALLSIWQPPLGRPRKSHRMSYFVAEASRLTARPNWRELASWVPDWDCYEKRVRNGLIN